LPAQAPADGQRPPSPLARRIATENNVDLSQVKGNSPHGRVTRDDVISYLEQNKQASSAQVAEPEAASAQNTGAMAVAPSDATAGAEVAARAAKPIPTTVPQMEKPAREERIRLSRRRQTIAQRLVETQQTAAMLTTFNEIDMSAVMEVRSRRKESFKERHNVSLGFMSFFTKAVVGALKAFPRLNSEIQGNELVLKHYYDIGIAVGAEEGLVVPVLRDADRKSFAEIEQEIADLAKKARNNTLTLPELQGGTFTITNGGVFGSLLSTPILNGPQAGILGMHKIEQRPVVVDGQIVIRPMMYVALSYDHRIVDGREAVQFLVRMKELVEDPETLLLEG
jgi:2-oxoglutarate dehydrogenase E2 component (dihydrolipoamide succinyltransferase)